MTLTTLLKRLCCPDNVPALPATQVLFGRDTIGILSASCCDATAAIRDDELNANLRGAMAIADDRRPVVFENITAAQRRMRQLDANADIGQKALANQVASLFQANGLSVFPMLVINGRLAFYGGVPSVEMIQQKLQLPAAD